MTIDGLIFVGLRGYALALDRDTGEVVWSNDQMKSGHGYAQVYLGGAWYNVDATAERARSTLVPIAVGRDAADVAMTTFWEAATLREQSVDVREGKAPDKAGRQPGQGS